MENETKIALIIKSAMNTLEERGYSNLTLRKHRETYCRLQRYCASLDVDEYLEFIGQQFIEFVQHCNPSMSYVMLQHYKKSIRRLDCLLSGVEWEPLRGGRRRQDYMNSCYDSVIHDYENYLARTGKTVKRIRQLVRMVAKFLEMIERFGCLQIKSISAEMILKGFEQATNKFGFRDTIGMFFQYAYNHEITKSNMRHLIPTVVQHCSVPSIYSPEEIECLLASIDRTSEMGKRDFAIILIAARLGLRASDISNLRFDNLKAGKIEIMQFKTKQQLTTILLGEVKEAILDYVDHGRPQSSAPYIFLNEGGYGVIVEASSIYALTRRAFIRSGIECGIRRMGPHSLRASLATALLSEGNDYCTIQMVLGHSNIQSTKSYAKADIEQLRAHAIPVPLPSGNFAALLNGEVCA